jgi:phosphohistidine phosphatase SixA
MTNRRREPLAPGASDPTSMVMMIRRTMAIGTLALAAIWPAQAGEQPGWAALADGAIVLFRHANAPGGGDPPGMRLGDCSTQRNLDAAGRMQAQRIGDAFRARGIKVGGVLTSQWCRASETAALAFPGSTTVSPAFNSFFGARHEEPVRTAAARDVIAAWRGPGALVAVTHHVNIGALTGIYPASGEGVVVRWQDGAIKVIDRIRP